MGEITLEQLRTKSREHYNAFYVQCYNAFVLRKTFDLEIHVLEDLFHETMEDFYAKIMFDLDFQVDNIQAWVFSMFKNKCLNHYNRNKRFESIEGIELSTDEDSNWTEVLRIKRMLKTLGQSCQELLKLAFYKGFGNNEIANRMGYSVNFAKNKKSRCIKKLRELMKKN